MGKINGYTLFPKKWSLEGFGMALSTSAEYNAVTRNTEGIIITTKSIQLKIEA